MCRKSSASARVPTFLQGRHRIRPRRSPSPLHDQPPSDNPGDVAERFPSPAMTAHVESAGDVGLVLGAIDCPSSPSDDSKELSPPARWESRIQGGDEAGHLQRTRAARAFGTLPSAYLIILGQSCGRTTPLSPLHTRSITPVELWICIGESGPGTRRGAQGPCANQGSPSRARILLPGVQVAGHRATRPCRQD